LPPDLPLVLDRVRLLLEASSRDASASDVEELEHTLTDGYAVALALEGECLRITRRMTELTRNGTRPAEVRGLARRLNGAEGDLSELRGLLAVLRVRAEDARRLSA
jgi:hypothetical protein